MSLAVVGTIAGTVDAWAGGNAAAGARKAIYCAYCHGQDGNPSSAGIPRLAGQDANLLVKKMRSQLPGMERRHLMYQAFVTGNLLDERSMVNLAAYYSGRAATP